MEDSRTRVLHQPGGRVLMAQTTVSVRTLHNASTAVGWSGNRTLTIDRPEAAGGLGLGYRGNHSRPDCAHGPRGGDSQLAAPGSGRHAVRFRGGIGITLMGLVRRRGARLGARSWESTRRFAQCPIAVSLGNQRVERTVRSARMIIAS